MDFLKAEIAAKKRKAQDGGGGAEVEASGSGSGSSKYVRRGEEERKREEEYRAREAEKKAARAEQLKEEERRRASRLKSKSTTPDVEGIPVADGLADASHKEVFNISSAEAVRRLRSKGEPIRLFGESDKERRLRLRALELIEGRGEQVGQNDFMRALKGAEISIVNEELQGGKGKDGKKAKEGKEDKDDEKKGDGVDDPGEEKGAADGAGGAGKHRDGVGMESLLDLSLMKRDINKVYPIIYYTLKGLLKDWEQTLAERPIEIRQSNQGKLVAATQVQSAEYLKPLFKQLRQRSVLPDVLARLAEIVHYTQKREYRNANDSYLQLSIGNAPWPIGVTMVGIHERSGREKIFSSNVAHVLNDEVSRKYIQSLKRLLTFAQTKYPPYLGSMLMG